MTTKFSFFKKGNETEPVLEVTVAPGDGAVVTEGNLGISPEDALPVIGHPYLLMLNEKGGMDFPFEPYTERSLIDLEHGNLRTRILATLAEVALGSPQLVKTTLLPARGAFSIAGRDRNFDFEVIAQPEIPEELLCELANRVRSL